MRGFVCDWRRAHHGEVLSEPPTAAAVEAEADGTFAATLRNVHGGDRDRMARGHNWRGIDEAHLRCRLC